MKVKAKKVGYSGSRIYPGTIFELKEKKIIRKGKEVIISAAEQFSHMWMEKVEEDKPVTDKVHVFEPETPAVDEVKSEPEIAEEKVTKKKTKKKKSDK